MDPKLAADVAYYLNGSSHTESDAAASFGISEEDVRRAAAIGEIECCGICDWWDETSNFNSNGNCLDCEADDGEG